MSENIDSESARLADTEYLVRRSMTKGYQLFSIITPPIYAGFSLFRKGRGYFTMNRLLRATWLGGTAGRHRKDDLLTHAYLTRAFRCCQWRSI